METGSGTENGSLTVLFMVNSLIWVIKFFMQYEKYQNHIKMQKYLFYQIQFAMEWYSLIL